MKVQDRIYNADDLKKVLCLCSLYMYITSKVEIVRLLDTQAALN